MKEKKVKGKLYILKECSYCKSELWRYKYAKQHKNCFCSKQCEIEFRKSGSFVKCAECGKDTYKARKHINKIRGDKFFCSRSCSASFHNKLRTGPKSGAWKDGSASYRQRALATYGKCCQNPNCEICGAGIKIPESMLDVHHVDGNRKNNDIENLVVLCVWCHAQKTRSVVEIIWKLKPTT